MWTDGVKVVLTKAFQYTTAKIKNGSFRDSHLVSVPGILGVEQLELFRNLWSLRQYRISS